MSKIFDIIYNSVQVIMHLLLLEPEDLQEYAVHAVWSDEHVLKITIRVLPLLTGTGEGPLG